MSKLKDLHVAVPGDPLETLRATTMTGRRTISDALIFNLINDLVARVEALESAPQCKCEEEKLIKKPMTKAPAKRAAKNASNQSGGTFDETVKVAEETPSE